MDNYSTIKELVIDACASEGKFPSYEKLTQLVLENFPSSKWKKSHYAWYKSKIKRGEIEISGESFQVASDDDATESDVEETIEASLSLERDLHNYLSRNVSEIEIGLQVIENGIEYSTEAGRIDILCKDVSGSLVVVELKAGKAKDSALGQLLGYIGCLSQSESNIRGILVASDFEKRVVFASKNLKNIKLVKYQLSFKFDEIT